LRIEILVIVYKLWRKCSTPTYFVTTCTFQRQHLLGTVNNGEMQLNVTGQIVSAIWQQIPQHFPNVELDEFILMPDQLF